MEIKRSVKNHQLYNLIKYRDRFNDFLLVTERLFPRTKQELRDENNVNQDFEQQYEISINLGRMESHPNFQMIKLLYISDYFNISISDFFIRVARIKEEDILEFLKIKEVKKE